VLPAAPGTITCPTTKKTYHDAYATLCPWCGQKNHKKDGDNKDPKTGSSGIKVTAEASFGYGPHDGGGGDQTDKPNDFSMSHYDDSFWENRMMVGFKLLGKIRPGTKIKKAELRMYVKEPPGKPFFPVLEVYSVPDKYKLDAKAPVVWNSQPPVDKLIFISGLYEGSDAPRWLCFDVTDCFKQKIKNNANFEIRGALSYSTYQQPHPLGHYLRFADASTDATKTPYLYFETE
jgi:hypothetical protein